MGGVGGNHGTSCESPAIYTGFGSAIGSIFDLFQQFFVKNDSSSGNLWELFDAVFDAICSVNFLKIYNMSQKS